MVNVVICGTKYELTKEPKHGVVRKIRLKEREVYKTIFSKFKDKINLNDEIDVAIMKIMRENPAEMIAYNELQEDNNLVNTISLATGNLFTVDDFDEMTEVELEEVFETCREFLEGDSKDFSEDSVSSIQHQTKKPAVKKKE